MGGGSRARRACPGALLLFATLAAGCTGGDERLSDPASADLSGTVTYRVPMTLPPNAVINVRLAEVSRQDMPADVISEVQVAAAGRPVPLPFRLSYPPGRIDPTRIYSVSARILVTGRVLMASTTTYPVLTGGAPNTVEILVAPPGTQSAEAGAEPEASED